MDEHEAYCFQVSIESCLNHSWQGELRHLDETYRFSSDLELLLMMDRILNMDKCFFREE